MRPDCSFLFSVSFGIRSIWPALTSIDLTLLHILPWHRIGSDDLWEGRCLEIFLAWLLFGPMLSRVLLHTLQMVGPSSVIVHIMSLLKELSRLFSHFQHPIRWISEHFYDARDLVVFRRAWEKRETEEKFHYYAAK